MFSKFQIILFSIISTLCFATIIYPASGESEYRLGEIKMRRTEDGIFYKQDLFIGESYYPTLKAEKIYLFTDEQVRSFKGTSGRRRNTEPEELQWYFNIGDSLLHTLLKNPDELKEYIANEILNLKPAIDILNSSISNK